MPSKSRCWTTLWLLLAACGGSGAPDGGAQATIALAPTSVTLKPGDAPVTFLATPSSGTVSWTLSPLVGTLSHGTGTSTTYTPPSTSGADQRLTLTATVEGTLASASATLTLTNGNGVLAVGVPVPVTGLDGGFTLAGPDHFLQTFNGPATLTVPPGAYDVSAGPGFVADSIVGELFEALLSGSPANVTPASVSKVTVTYALRPETGRLWMADCGSSATGGSAVGYPVADLRSGSLGTGMALPATAPGAMTLCAEAVAFDASGQAWVVDLYDNLLWGYAFDLDGGALPPVVLSSLSDGGFGLLQPTSAAFAPNGDLWVANYQPSSLVRFTPDQLTSSGEATPRSIIVSAQSNGALPSLSHPNDLAFDAQGGLWVVNNASPGSLVRYAPVGAGALESVPSTVLYDDGGALDYARGVAVDAAGNLWVAPFRGVGVARIAVTGLTGTQRIAPSAVLGTAAGAPFQGPANLTFDASGSLWVVDGFLDGGAQLVRIDKPSSYTGSVVPSVAAALQNAPSPDTGRMQFDPPAHGLSLRP